MNVVIIGFLILINCFAILLNIKMTTGMDTQRKVTIIAVEEVVLFIIMNIIYTICVANVEIKNPSMSRMFQVFTFTGINMMAIFAPINKLLTRRSTNDIKSSEFNTKMHFKLVMTIILLVIEFLYIKSLI